ncbi:MAG: SDR family oxidoreductase [Rhodothermales bacterium]|nr:SDR family oxidoreductase [Rhodothermales bacterium]
MNTNLANKVYLVAASSKGLGFGIAEALAADGARVSLCSRTRSEIEQAATDLKTRYGVDARGYVCDASQSDSISDWVSQSISDFGTIDGLVVNAGGPKPGKFDSFSDEDWDKAYNLTLMSAVRMIRAALPTMKAKGAGSIVTVTSSSIKEPIGILLLSNVFRSGVVSLVKSLSVDLAPHGIRINNLVPGSIDTDRIRSNDIFAAERMGISPEERKAYREAEIPLGRYGTPEEFGKVGAFLLSDAASYISGSTIMVDGGKSKTVW